MALRQSLGMRLRWVARRLEAGPLGELLRRLGLDRAAQWAYFQLFRLVVGELERSVGGTKASFSVDDWGEYKRTVELMGERQIIEHLLNAVSEDDVFYDVGANTGIYSCFVGKTLQSGSVFAFEPHPANAEQCRSNLELNGIDGTVYQLALAATSGTAELNVADQKAGAGTHSLRNEEGRSSIRVDTRRGDELIAEDSLPTPTVMKIDVEGAELDVIRGMEETLRDDSFGTLYCEVHRNGIEEFGHAAGDVGELLRDWGFDVERIRERGDQFFVCARK